MSNKRRMSSVLHMEERDFAQTNVVVCSEAETLQSGMMLNHCILYKELSFKAAVPKSFDFLEGEAHQPAYVINILDKDGRKEHTVTLEDAVASLPPIGEGICWIHIIDKKCLSLVAEKYNMHPIASRAFLDTLPRTTVNFFDKTSFMCAMTSFCKHTDGMICIIKFYMYIRGSIIISQERRTFALSPPTPHPSIPSQDTSQRNPSLHNMLHTTKASHVVERENSSQLLSSEDHRGGGRYQGRVFADICIRVQNTSTLTQITKLGASYFLYEVAYVMLEMTAPVISFYSQRQLRLHDVIYVREQPPNHTEGNAILDRVDFIKSGFQLMENLTDRSTKCLIENKDNISKFLPEEWVSDVISSYEHALDVITDMDTELSRITENINSMINRRNEQISIVLSLVATVFLPLTFIAGIFGMNFQNGGILVKMLHQRNGTNWFWGSCASCVVICIYIFVRKGWMDMLGKVRRGGHTVATAAPPPPSSDDRIQ